MLDLSYELLNKGTWLDFSICFRCFFSFLCNERICASLLCLEFLLNSLLYFLTYLYLSYEKKELLVLAFQGM
jgi:hypothetical protein